MTFIYFTKDFKLWKAIKQILNILFCAKKYLVKIFIKDIISFGTKDIIFLLQINVARTNLMFKSILNIITLINFFLKKYYY